LTLDPARRTDRALAAAQVKYQSGAFGVALGLVSVAQAGPLDEVQRVRVCLLRGRITLASSHGSDTPPLLLKAATKLRPHDARMARDTYLEALLAAMYADHLVTRSSVWEIAEAARAAAPSTQLMRAPDLLLDGLALLITEGYPVGAPALKRAVSAFGEGDVSAEEALRCLWLATVAQAGMGLRELGRAVGPPDQRRPFSRRSQCSSCGLRLPGHGARVGRGVRGGSLSRGGDGGGHRGNW
jgi:hypothetical protein